MSEPVIRIGLADHDLNRAIIDGVIKPEGFAFDVRCDLEDGERHARMLGEREFDACEFSFANYLVQRELDPFLTGLAVFPNRKFRHSYIFVNTDSGIERPGDLIGKRVGSRGYATTACVWIRGLLSDYYGVDLSAVRWFATPGPVDHAVEPSVPVTPLPSGTDLDQMLVNGELDAVILPDPLPSLQLGRSMVRRLFPDYKSEEQEFYRQTGIFPISHLLAVKKESLAEHPSLALELLRAFRRSRDVCFARIEDLSSIALSWILPLLDEQRALMGHSYWRYNVPDNTVPLNALVGYAREQGLIREPVDLHDLFIEPMDGDA
jgi:4,5-dihydroxyphthalate decarboxylase